MDYFLQNMQGLLIVLKRRVLIFLKSCKVSWKSAEYTAMAHAPIKNPIRISLESEMTLIHFISI